MSRNSGVRASFRAEIRCQFIILARKDELKETEEIREEIRAGSLWGLPPRAPTEPGVRISRARFVSSWLRCPSHGQAVLR